MPYCYKRIKATQWFKLGDHKDVRPYRMLGAVGEICDRPRCQRPAAEHGMYGDVIASERVCPGDWIVEDWSRTAWVLSPASFAELYALERGEARDG